MWGDHTGICDNPASGTPVQVPGLTCVRSASLGWGSAYLVVADPPRRHR